MARGDDKAERKPRKGETWMNPVTGQIYKWDGKVWRPTGKYPYGGDPYDLINNNGTG